MENSATLVGFSGVIHKSNWQAPNALFLFGSFGTAVFAFEGISLVLPLQKDMRTPRQFEGLTGVLNTGMVTVSALYFAVGFYGYLKYGEVIKGSITLNLPSEDL